MIAGLVAIGNVVASPPLVNESVAIPKILAATATDTGQKIQAEASPGAVSASANQLSRFNIANYAIGGDANLNPLDKIASNNNGANVTASVAAVINNSQAYNTGNSDSTFVANAVTLNIAPLDTSPPTAAVGCLASANIAQVESEGGVCSGAILASTGTYTDPVGVDSNRAALAYAA